MPPDRTPQDQGPPLSQGDLERSLSDVRAEIYLIEVQRAQTKRLLASPDVQRDPAEVERLSKRQRLIASRLEKLEAKTAGLRAILERVLACRGTNEQREGRAGSEPTAE